MWKLHLIFFAIGLLFSVGNVGAQSAPPDQILVNGKVVTVDDTFSIAEAIAVRGNRIVAVGSNAEIRRLAGSGTKVVDVGGKTVIPGLIDNHVHVIRESTYWTQEVRFDGVTSRRKALEMIRDRANSARPGEWITVIAGWTEDQFKDEKSGFTLEELDRAAPRNPVYIQRLFDRAYINSLAIKAAGITDKTPNPKRGKIVRDKNGKPTGLLTGRSWRLVRGKIPKLSFEQILASARAVTRVFNQVGVTAVLDVGGGGSYEPGYKAFEKLKKDGDLTIRTFYTLFQPKPDKLLKQLKSSSPPVRKDDYYQLIGIGETFYRPLHDNTYRDFKTNPKHSANLRELADIAARKGWHVHMHATHDKSISHFLDIFEKVHKTTPLTPLRWVFAHADAVGPGSLARMRALGMMVAIHSRTTIQGRMYHKKFRKKALGMPPLRAIRDSGVRWGIGTDTFGVAPYNPFYTLWWATTGKMLDGSVVHNQTVSREDALRAHTRSNAYFLFQEDNLGSIEKGKLADLVILDRDYMTVPLDEIKEIRPTMTMVGGKVVYRSSSE